MAKAMLTSVDISGEPLNLYDINGHIVSSVHEPMRYTYSLTYVSYEPLNIADFPAEIDSDHISKKTKKINEISKEERKKIIIKNPIQSLEI